MTRHFQPARRAQRQARGRLTQRTHVSMLRAVPVHVRHRARNRTHVRAAVVRHRGERMLEALSLERAELSIVLCDDAMIRGLNRRHRGFDRATDVLAFAMGEGEALASRGPQLLGDVVISLPTAARQARAVGKDTLAEVTLLLAHGLLHLLGFDHQTEHTERCMRARTDALIAAARRR